MVLDVYKARMNMPILNKEYSDAMRNLSSAEAQALAVPLCTEVYYIHFYRIRYHSMLFCGEIRKFLHVYVYNVYRDICTYAYQSTCNKILHLEALLVTITKLWKLVEFFRGMLNSFVQG